MILFFGSASETYPEMILPPEPGCAMRRYLPLRDKSPELPLNRSSSAPVPSTALANTRAPDSPNRVKRIVRPSFHQQGMSSRSACRVKGIPSPPAVLNIQRASVVTVSPDAAMIRLPSGDNRGHPKPGMGPPTVPTILPDRSIQVSCRRPTFLSFGLKANVPSVAMLGCWPL